MKKIQVTYTKSLSGITKSDSPECIRAQHGSLDPKVPLPSCGQSSLHLKQR